MRLGVIAFSTETGLGFQSADYVKHFSPVKVLDIDITKLNGMQHLRWHANARVTDGYPSTEDCEWITDGVDAVIMAETPLNYGLYKIARRKGVKTINVINAEFYDHIKYPDFAMPDLIILPSIWHMEEIKTHCESRGTKFVQLHHPVDRELHPFRLRTGKRTMHTAGKPAAYDRNGTWDYMQAVPDGTIVTQDEAFANHVRKRYRHSKVYTGITDHNVMYSYGDIFVLPRKYGGNCLPLNEALSHGLPVIMPDISPNNNLLPKEWLVPATVTDFFEPRGRVDIYSADIEAMRERIAWVAENIEEQSKIANQIADSISWETLKPKYFEAIESIL